jgi:RNA polymerase sigma-70 factor (ECF subfamily)
MENTDEMLNFEDIYLSWFSKMKHFAKEYRRTRRECRKYLQDVFMELWEKRPILIDRIRLTAYLFTAVKNRSFNCLRRRIMKQEAVSRI